MQTKRGGFTVARSALGLFGHLFSLPVEHLRHERAAGITVGQDIRLNRHRRVFEDGLAHGDLLQRDVFDGIVPADDDRIHGRQTGCLNFSGGNVRGIAVGQEKNARQRLSLVTLHDSPQRRTDCRRPPIKDQL